jgi:tripartite-type tricarboxylate transporter receptor subunit TctC
MEREPLDNKVQKEETMFAHCRRIIPHTMCLCLMLCAFLVWSNDAYPQKAVEIFAGTPGSLGDMWIRAWTDEYSRALKTPVVVVNKGGALSQWIQLSMAKPDGHGLAQFSYPTLVGYAIASKPPFDFFKDFAAVGAFGSSSTVLAIEKSSPFANFEDLIAYAKKNPKKLKCGTAGIHMHDHFAVELIKEYTGADIVMVPFKGSNEVVTALLGKHVDLISIGPAPVLGLMRAGRVRTILSVMRLKEFPEVPLFSEKGVGDAGMVNWTGIYTQSAVPKENLKKLVDAYEKVARDPKVIEKIDKLGFTGDYLSPAALTPLAKRDYDKIYAVVKRLGISE